MSCNDLSIEREPLAAYLLEQISLYEGGDCLGGELQKVADSWMESVYFTRCDFKTDSKVIEALVMPVYYNLYPFD